MMIRTPCIAAFYLLIKPKVVLQWENSLKESYKLDILFTVFKDIPLFISSVLMLIATDTGINFFNILKKFPKN